MTAVEVTRGLVHALKLEILRLRELHAVMGQAVLDAYGWTALKPICEFLRDHEDEEDQELATSNRDYSDSVPSLAAGASVDSWMSSALKSFPIRSPTTVIRSSEFQASDTLSYR